MGKSKDKRKGSAKADPTVARLPKKKCCVSSSKCNRCPLRMLKEGTLPPGYTVKKRRLVKVEVVGATAGGAPGTKSGKGGKKREKKRDRAA